MSSQDSGQDPASTDEVTVLAGLQVLHEAGALGGVAALIAERVRQVRMGYTPEHDLAEHSSDAALVSWPLRLLEGWYDERALTQAGVMLAAEIDRLRGAS